MPALFVLSAYTLAHLYLALRRRRRGRLAAILLVLACAAVVNYDFVNVPRHQEITIHEEARQRLEDFCAPWNAELAAWIEKTYPGSYFPDWRTEAHYQAA